MDGILPVLLLSLGVTSRAQAQSNILSTRTLTTTLSDVTRRPDATSSANEGGVIKSTLRSNTPVGTASDGSLTTYSEQEVEYHMTVSGGSTSTFSTDVRNGLRKQSQSGYVRLRTGSVSGGVFSSAQTCSYGLGTQPGCLDVLLVQIESMSTDSTLTTTRTVYSATTRTLAGSEATILPAQTLLATSVSSSIIEPTPVTPVATETSISQPASAATERSNTLAPAIAGSVGGFVLILLVLIVFMFLRHRKRQQRSKSQARVRDTMVDSNVPEFKYHYKASEMASSVADSTKEKDCISIDSSPSTSSSKPHYPKSFHSPSNSHTTLSSPTKGSHYHHPSSPLSTPPLRLDDTESIVPASTIDSVLSQSTIVASPPRSRQNTAETSNTVASDNSAWSSHPGHGFRIQPTRFIERLSLSSTYLESLTAGGLSGQREDHQELTMADEPLSDVEDEVEEQKPHTPTFPANNSPPHSPTQDHPSPSHSPTQDHPSPPHSPMSMDHGYYSPPHSPSTDQFVTPSQTPYPYSSSSLSLSHPTFRPSESPSLPSQTTFPPSSWNSPHPPATPRSMITPSPFSHQTFQTASEGLDTEDEDDRSTLDQLRHGNVRASFASSQSNLNTQYGYAV